MSEILAITDGASTGSPVLDVATTVGAVAHATVRTLRLPPGTPDTDNVEWVLDALAQPSVEIGVLAAAEPETALCWNVVSRAAKPVVLVPPGVEVARPAIGRVLVPLDGTSASSAAVSDMVGRLSRAGIDIVVLHVFDAETAPRFWDQAAYAPRTWAEEFLSRHVSAENARMEIRAGTPGQQVVDVAEAESVDLIALGWSQQLDPDRAQTVRQSVLGSGVPVLLVPLVDG